MNSEFKRIRANAGLNIEDFARVVGCHPSSIERVERGEIAESPELVAQLRERLVWRNDRSARHSAIETNARVAASSKAK